MRRQKEYRELTFTDDFLFCKILQNNPDICRELVELLLGRKIARICSSEKQKTIDITPDGKGVRLDVYFDDETGVVYDIEMQTNNTGNIPKRSRYYQGVVDLDLINAGADYNDLKRTYIIFINLFDLFHEGLPRYTFENRCLEKPGLRLNDETFKVFINARSQLGAMSPDLREILAYLCGALPKSNLSVRIQGEVDRARSNEDWEVSYMTLYHKYREMFTEGKEEGRAEGRAEAWTEIIQKLHDKGMPLDDIVRFTGESLDNVTNILTQDNNLE